MTQEKLDSYKVATNKISINWQSIMKTLPKKKMYLWNNNNGPNTFLNAEMKKKNRKKTDEKHYVGQNLDV